jgi:signal-transduction protein with cAMP-binding, CBS, and nucleotidyltransferase domain
VTLAPQFFDMPRFLAGSPLFSGLSPDELLRITQSSDLKNYARGEMIFSVGHACEAVHIVVSGQVKLFVVSPAGHEKVIELCPAHAGGFFKAAAWPDPGPGRLCACATACSA